MLEPLDLKNINFENICKRLEAVARRCSVKKFFLGLSQSSQEKTCARVFFNKDAGQAWLVHNMSLKALKLDQSAT